MATINDVARAAGVSAATVSRVFNGGRVTAELAERVLRSAAELRFAPNRVARALRMQRSSVISLIIPDITDPYFSSLARGVEDAAQQKNHSVVLCNSDEDLDKERRYLDTAQAEQMAGVIIAVASRSRTDLSPFTGMPVVAVDRRPLGAAVDAVVIDNQHGGEQATAHLLRGGYRRIACVTGPEGTSTAEERLTGYRVAMGEHLRELGRDHAQSRELIRYADLGPEGGRDAMDDLLALEEPPDAVFVTNDLMAVGVLEALRAADREPPRTGVLTFGDAPRGTLAGPSLSTVRPPSYDAGRTAVGLLLDRISDKDGPRQTVVLQTTLHVRSSSKRPSPRP
ncbi:LacI family DNA-binding transcriptional regulator [Streptomyces sp. NPDC060048]|uniref:LacI family DNA-binding transcriptional regulator n=1 Tax=unclassified Streptomyces TaxID=2593676 RepID=UPI00368B4DBF